MTQTRARLSYTLLLFILLACGQLEEKNEEKDSAATHQPEILTPENLGEYSGTEIGLLLLYPVNAESHFSTIKNNTHFNPDKIDHLPTYMATVIRDTNDVFQKSEIKLYFKINGIRSVDFSSYGDAWQETLVKAMMNADTTPWEQEKEMVSHIQELQAVHKADIALLWRGYNDGSQAVSGASAIACKKTNCLTQLHYFSFPDIITTAHELGHLFGARHEHGLVQEKAVSFTISGKPLEDRFATIMSTTDLLSTGGLKMTRVFRFSSANQKLSSSELCQEAEKVGQGVRLNKVDCQFAATTPLGDSTHDVVGIINAYKDTIASYH